MSTSFVRVMRSNANLLVLDEATNDLDIDSLQTLENALADYDGAVLFVTHDRFLINKIATAVVAFDPRTSTFERFEGDYDFYLTCKKKQDALRAESESQTRKADAQKQTASQQRAVKAKKLSFQEKKNLKILRMSFSNGRLKKKILKVKSPILKLINNPIKPRSSIYSLKR